MGTNGLTVQSLIAGYEAYASPAEIAMADFDNAPALSPTASLVTFVTASSPECIAFSMGASAASVGTTLAAGC